MCEDGSLGAMDMLAMHDRVHEVGAYYQAHLATNLRAFGIEVVLDAKTETARLPAVPEAVCEVFSKRTRDGEAAAREYVRAQGLDWDAMHPMELAGVLKGGTRATRRQKETGHRGDDMTDLAAWKVQAAEIGYQHATVIRPEAKKQPSPDKQDRLRHAYDAALPVLERQLTRRATLQASVARTAAARGLIASGVESAGDIDRITAAMREHGVRHDGQQVPLMWAEVTADGEGAAIGNRRPRVKITTTLHVEQEREAMALAQAAAGDRRRTLAPEHIEQAVQRVSERDGLDFASEHGREQRRIIDALGTSGRFAVAIGVGGAGKTTLLRPLVEAWTDPASNEAPRAIYGTALAWRQSDPLADAGIKPANTMAIAALLTRGEAGTLDLSPRTVVVVDELSQVGTAQALGLLRLQQKHGFSVVAIGDDRQAQAIDAGSTIELLRRALGAEAVPELESSVRQLRQRDRETSLLFRAGQAEEAIERLREDGHAVLVQGGRRHAVEAVADLWQARHQANAGRDGFTLTVSAPTNSDARMIGAAIRERRRTIGDLGPDQVELSAIDQAGATYELPLAVGDRVRLFARTPASFNGKGGNLGNNGSVLTVERIEAGGLQMRNAKGSSGFVKWDTLRDPASERIRLAYGDVVTIDAIQSATSTEHINAMVSGSQAVHSFKGYVAQSRSRETTWLVASDGAERSEIMSRRALGSVAPISEADVWANVARNLSRQPEKGLATALLDGAHQVNVGTIRSLATAFQPIQQRQVDGKDGTTFHHVQARRQDDRQVQQASPVIQQAAERTAAAVQAVTQHVAASQSDTRKAVQAARRAARPTAAQPKIARRPALMSQTDAQAEFTDALQRAGLRPKGAPIMDGRKHRVPVEGDRKGRLSGTYIGHLDGTPAGYIRNHKTGDEIRWKVSRPTRELTPQEREQESARIAADRVAKDAERSQREKVTSHKAQAIWNRAKPVQTHPYLTRKGITGHGMRQDRTGSLLVPMRDVEGRIWSLQTISPEGSKLYLRDGRKQGMHALLGTVQSDQPLVVAEGFATAATMREVTALAVAVAFDSGNLADVARAYRTHYADLPIVIAADNDHHLPRRTPPLPNVGTEKAAVAAKEVGGAVLLPAFTAAEPGTDWNDYAAAHGRAMMRETIQAELKKHGVELAAETVKAARTAPTVVTQAMRDAARLRSSPTNSPSDQAAQRAAQSEQQQTMTPRL